jgi:hypothetical protein
LLTIIPKYNEVYQSERRSGDTEMRLGERSGSGGVLQKVP